jgi:hypothetical protein
VSRNNEFELNNNNNNGKDDDDRETMNVEDEIRDGEEDDDWPFRAPRVKLFDRYDTTYQVLTVDLAEKACFIRS